MSKTFESFAKRTKGAILMTEQNLLDSPKELATMIRRIITGLPGVINTKLNAEKLILDQRMKDLLEKGSRKNFQSIADYNHWWDTWKASTLLNIKDWWEKAQLLQGECEATTKVRATSDVTLMLADAEVKLSDIILYWLGNDAGSVLDKSLTFTESIANTLAQNYGETLDANDEVFKLIATAASRNARQVFTIAKAKDPVKEAERLEKRAAKRTENKAKREAAKAAPATKK